MKGLLLTLILASFLTSFPEVRRNDRSHNREKSHDLEGVKNSIVGDVHIRNGHRRLEIKGIQSKQTMIDASVHSTVILGDMKK